MVGGGMRECPDSADLCVQAPELVAAGHPAEIEARIVAVTLGIAAHLLECRDQIFQRAAVRPCLRRTYLHFLQRSPRREWCGWGGVEGRFFGPLERARLIFIV